MASRGGGGGGGRGPGPGPGGRGPGGEVGGRGPGGDFGGRGPGGGRCGDFGGRGPGGGRGGDFGGRGPGGGRGGDFGGRGPGGGRGGDFGGRGPGGGRGGGFQQQPYGRGGGFQQAHGRGEGGGRGGVYQQRGRGGGEVHARPAAPRPAAPVVVPAAASTSARPPPPPTAAASSSSAPAPPPAAAAAASALARDMGRLAVADPAPRAPAPRPGAPAPAARSEADAAAYQKPQLPPVSSKGIAHPARPGVGTIGKKVVVRANHFLVDVADNDIVHYDVSINPEPKAKSTNRVLLSELVKAHGATSLARKTPAYDGRKSLYTAGELPFTSMDFVVKLGKERREIEYKITLRRVGCANLYHMHEFLQGRQRDSPQDTIQALDVVLRESPSLNYVTVSRSFFSKAFGHSDIGEGLECWRGYYQSLRPTQLGLSLNIDISSTAFYKPIPVIEFVQNLVRGINARQPIADRDRLKIKKALRGVRVETTHGKRSAYKITGITSVPLARLNFSPNVDDHMTVVQYFASRYNYRLQYTAWPCLQSGNDSKPIYLPMELIYARCTRSVSVVPPVYYAHLAAFRARDYDDREGTDAGGAGGPPAFRRLPQVKDNVKNVMFFC
ncbi:hypothetical protein EJB05_14748, partial [Eragrostis curvula]